MKSKYNFYIGLLLVLLVTQLVLLISTYYNLLEHKALLMHLKERYVSYLDQLQTNYGQDHECTPQSSLILPSRPAYNIMSITQQHPFRSIQKKNPSIPSKTLTKKSDFAWPLKMESFWLSSYFGARKKKNGQQGFHQGIDLAALKNTPVYSAQEGVVYQVGNSPQGYGKYIKIKHKKEYETRYAHLNSIVVKKGQHVHKGMLIGRVGSTGAVWGKNASHLHFEVLCFAKHINPLSVL